MPYYNIYNIYCVNLVNTSFACTAFLINKISIVMVQFMSSVVLVSFNYQDYLVHSEDFISYTN